MEFIIYDNHKQKSDLKPWLTLLDDAKIPYQIIDINTLTNFELKQLWHQNVQSFPSLIIDQRIKLTGVNQQLLAPIIERLVDNHLVR